jgi:uncharacterized cofD-like protein
VGAPTPSREQGEPRATAPDAATGEPAEGGAVAARGIPHPAIELPRPAPGQVRAVSIGGGTGQPNTIRALMRLGCFVTAIVSMVDDGGSTGILREKTGIVPPGDIRKCLVAMADPSREELARAFQHRFAFADDHALGNLMLTSLTEEAGSFERAVAICNRLLGCSGLVMPSTLDNVTLSGVTRDGVRLDGEAVLGTGQSALERVWLHPGDPQAYEPAVRAIMEADVVVLGPGSLFTSVIPNVLVPGIRSALRATEATRVFVCSLADMQGETWGLSVPEHVDALLGCGLEGAVDVLIVHRPSPRDESVATRSFQSLTQEQFHEDILRRAAMLGTADPREPGPDWYFRPVPVSDEQLRQLEGRIPTVIARDFADPKFPTWHDLGKLSIALQGVIEACRSPRR